MNAPLHFVLPDLGEGLADAELVAWHVAVGDEVTLNQVLVEVETEKAVVELPSPFAGTVVELLAAPGETVRVGAPLIAIATATATSTETADSADRRLEVEETALGDTCRYLGPETAEHARFVGHDEPPGPADGGLDRLEVDW